MDKIALKLASVIDEHITQLKALSDAECSYKSSPEKWSHKEIIGHMIDSAQNNIRRFVVAQYEVNPFIIYDQDKWVSINNYQHQPLENIVQLWYLINMQIVNILKNTSADMAQNICTSQDIHTIEWLASDYIKHLRHHLHHVLNLEPVAYP